MPYTSYDPTLPDGSKQTGPQVTPSIRSNLRAMIDAFYTGGLKGWNLTVGGPNYAQPGTLTYTNGGEKIRALITWDSNGNPTTITYDRDYGSGYQRIGVKTIRYAGDGSVLSSTWS